MAETGTAPSVAYKNRLLDKADKYLFLVAFAIGALSIIGLKIADVRQLYVTAIPVSVMLVYGLYIMLSPRYRLRDDRAGDSMYYLGFLFTMVSLAYSLYEFGTTEGGPRSIVTNFGIALATTIIGLMLRVLYHQFRQDPFDVEKQVRLELSEAADKLKDEIHETMINFASLRLGIVQSLTEAKSNIADTIATATKDTTDKYKSAMAAASDAVSAAATKVTTSFSSVAKGIESCTQQITNSGTSLSNAVTGLSSTVSEQDKAVRQHGQNLVAAIDAVIAQVKRLEISPDLLKAPVKATLEHLDAEIKMILKEIEAEQTRVAAVVKLIETNAGSSAALSNELALLQKEAATQRETIRVAAADLDRTLESVGSAASALVATEDKNLQEHRKILQQLQTDTAGTLKAVQTYREKLMAEVQQSSAMLTQVHKSLVDLTRTVVEQVSGRRP